MKTVGFCPIVLFCVAAFAGCVGSGSSAEAPSAAEPVHEAEPARFSETTGAIAGLVVDDSINPIPNALVGIQETSANTTTDATGHFTFSQLAPARYTLFANALGFESQGRPVEVAAGAIVEAKFVLAPLPTEEPYIDIKTFDGLIECGFGTAAVVGNCIPLQFLFQMIGQNPTNTRTVGLYPVTNPAKVVQGVFEQEWTPSAGGTSKELGLYVDSEGTGPTSGTNYEQANGPSPVKIVVGPEPYQDLKPDEKKDKVQTRTFLPGTTPPSVTINQRFRIWATACYLEECGDLYLAIKDA